MSNELEREGAGRGNGNGEEAGRDENLLPLDESAVALPAEVESAVQTIAGQIAEYEGRGEEGLRPLRLLLDRVGEAVFSTGEAAIGKLQEEEQHDSIPADVILFAARNVEVLIRALEGLDTLGSAVRFVLREAPEGVVVAHALAAIDVMRQASAAHLRERGYTAYKECLTVAQARGFGERVRKAFEAAETEGEGDAVRGDEAGGNS